MTRLSIATLFALLISSTAQAADPAAGQTAWMREVPASDGPARSCTSCHGADPRLPGKHVRTGKAIAAMAPSVEKDRLTDPAKTQKWFTRNCKWTWGRLCTPEEQADIKAWLYTF